MGIKITRLGQQAVVKQLTVDRRLWVTKDAARLVEDGHPDAATLFCAPGQAVSEDEFNRYELVAVAESEAATGEAESMEEIAPPKKKARRKVNDKAVAAPEGDKGE